MGTGDAPNIPHVEIDDPEIAWGLAKTLIEHRRSLLDLGPEHIRQLMSLAQNWREFSEGDHANIIAILGKKVPSLGISPSSHPRANRHAIESFILDIARGFPVLNSHQRDDVELPTDALQAFVDSPQSPEGEAVLSAFAASLQQRVNGLMRGVEDGGATVASLQDAELDSLESDLSLLQVAAIQTRAPFAVAVAEDAGKQVEELQIKRDTAFLVKNLLRLPPDRPTFSDIETIHRLSRRPGWTEGAVEMIARFTSPHERERLIRQLSQAHGFPEANDAYTVVSPLSFDLASKIHQLDHPGQPFHLTGGSHWLIGRLFQAAGKLAEIHTPKGKRSVQILGVYDLEEDLPGSIPVLVTRDPQQPTVKIEKIDLTTLSAMTVDGEPLFDSTVHSPLLPRVFVAPPWSLTAARLMANVECDKEFGEGFDALVSALALGRPSLDSPLHELTDEVLREFFESLPPDDAQALVPSDIQPLVELYPELAACKRSSAEGSVEIIPGTEHLARSFQAHILVSIALSLLEQDIGPLNKGQVALTAAAAIEHMGPDMDESLHEILQHGPDDERSAILRRALAESDSQVETELRGFVALNDQLEPFVRAVLGDRSPPFLFLPREAIITIQRVLSLMKQLREPSPDPQDQHSLELFRPEADALSKAFSLRAQKRALEILAGIAQPDGSSDGAYRSRSSEGSDPTDKEGRIRLFARKVLQELKSAPEGVWYRLAAQFGEASSSDPS